MTNVVDPLRIDKWKDASEFRARVSTWAERIHVEPRAVHIRPMERKWASCSTRGLVSFSTRLLEEKPEFGEYVIVHELLHLKVPNHGKLFKSLLRAYLPYWDTDKADAISCAMGAAGQRSAVQPQPRNF